ncbi:MAG: hypothetical protein JW953_10525 [Anaerolineae bacterium]|nr:hypothetical protein [Anaerolineae bacterium]
MTIEYNLKNLRSLLTEGFGVEELRFFCYDHPNFRPVYEQLAESAGKTQVVHKLIEYAEQKNLFEPLLDWAKEENPSRYEKYQPYHITSTGGDYKKPVSPEELSEPENETISSKSAAIKNVTDLSPTYLPRLSFSVIIILILIVAGIYYLITGQNTTLTKTLISGADVQPSTTIEQIFDEETGAFQVEATSLLRISTLRYRYYDGTVRDYKVEPLSQPKFHALPVEWGEEGWKIRLEQLLEKEQLQQKPLPLVPQEIDLKISYTHASDNPILVYVLTDEIYPQQLQRQFFPKWRESFWYEGIIIGQRGVNNFINLDNFSVTSELSPNIIEPGLGPLAAIVAVEFENKKPKLRSDLVFVIRKGILHPNDIWYDRDRRPYLSGPATFAGERMIAFQSPDFSQINDIIISPLDGLREQMTRLDLPVFQGHEQVICGWGDDVQNRNTLYFLSSEEGNTKAPYKVTVINGKISEPIRLTSTPASCTR